MPSLCTVMLPDADEALSLCEQAKVLYGQHAYAVLSVLCCQVIILCPQLRQLSLQVVHLTPLPRRTPNVTLSS